MKLFRYKAPFQKMNGTTYINSEPQLALIRNVNKKDEALTGFPKNKYAYVCARVWTGGQVLKHELYYLTKKELNNEYVLLNEEAI